MFILTPSYIAYLLLSLSIVIPENFAKIQLRSNNICDDYDGRRIYLDLGGEGVLHAKNNIGVSSKFTSGHHQCNLDLISCPSCIISVTFLFLNISRNCDKISVVDSCGCDYVWIYEPPFEDVSGEQFCGNFVESNNSQLIYKSQTRTTSINFLFSSFHEYAFTLKYTSERNRQTFDGNLNKYTINNNTNQYITSPFFPHLYPRDLNTEYIITCRNQVELCLVRLLFLDFQLSASSLIEIFDSNGQRISVVTGALFRPPIITTSGPKMVVRFHANGGTNLGFRATYNFLRGESNATLNPDTDCGGHVDNLGGAITMMTMIEANTKAYDCFWIIRPLDNFLHLKTQIYVKITVFSDFAGPTDLILRQGITSKEPIVETLRYPSKQYPVAKQREHIVPIQQGFYISLKGLFRPETRLAIVYSAFNYKACYSGSDYLCRNMRCISAYLVCDGFDHCGDNTDEITTCLKEANERSSSPHTPNFYFPKNDRYTYLRTATIIFVVCSIGLMVLIFTLVLILYRLNLRNRTGGHLQSHLQTINDMLDEGVVESVIEEIIEPDEPPLYEAPPNYDSVLKSEKHISKNKCRSKCSSHSIIKRDTKTSSNPTSFFSQGLIYRQLSHMESNEYARANTAIITHINENKAQCHMLLKHLSLENINVLKPQHHLSLDMSKVKLYDTVEKNQIANACSTNVTVRWKQKRRFSSISETLLASISSNDTILKRSVSIENSFPIL